MGAGGMRTLEKRHSPLLAIECGLYLVGRGQKPKGNRKKKKEKLKQENIFIRAILQKD